MTKYNNIINVEQAYPVAKITVSDYFPLIDENITLINNSTDADVFTWNLNDGNQITQNSIDKTVTFPIHKIDDTVQSINISNTVGNVSLTKHIYPLPVPTEAYYEFTLSTGVSREDELVTLTLINKYNYINSHSVTIVITNHITNAVVLTIVATGLTNTFSLPTVGTYDIEVQANTNGYVIYNKQGMVLTVTKKMADKANALVHNFQPTNVALGFYGTPYSEINGANYNFTNTLIEPGTTIIIHRDEAYPENSTYRLKLSNLSGTAENPIIITIDRATPLEILFDSYWGIFIGNCQHVILDGRGYQNIQYGFHIHRNPLATLAVICIQAALKSSDVEFHNIECSDSDFSGITFKSDPDPNDPTTWRPDIDGASSGFTCYNLKIHNTYMHETLGEGNYIGYFDAGLLTHADSSGNTHTYRAHKLIDTKIYRNRYYRCGWDSIQCNNAYGNSEISYNTVLDSAFLGETNQNTCMSISLQGSVIGNIMNGGGGVGIQVLPFGTLIIANNLICNLPDGVSTIMLLGGEGLVPETTPNKPANLANDILIDIFNNTFIANGNGYIISAQNVVQYHGMLLRNCVVRYRGTNLFAGQDTATIALWEANKRNNINLVTADYPLYKIGSIEDSDYNIYPDSILGTGGLLIGSLYDIRGYKNWTTNTKFIGAYSSIIKLPETVLQMLTLTINNGATQTNLRTATLGFTAKGYPTHYMASESPTFVGASWSAITSTINFTLSENDGTKTVYFKIKNNIIESNSISAAIFYSETLKYLINLSVTNPVYNAPEPWNNINSDAAPVGLLKAGLIDQYSGTSTLSLKVVSPFDGNSSNAQSNEIYPYLAKAVGINWTISKTGTTGIGTIQLSGCSPSKLYDILMYSNRQYGGGDMIYSVNNIEQGYNNTFPNINNICTFTNVVAWSGGTINISLKPDQGQTHDGELGLLDIRVHSSKPILNSISINSGDTGTFSTTVTVNVNESILPTEYLISESPTFVGATWLPWGNISIPYTFVNNTVQTKTIYLKLRNAGGESSVASDTINYLGTRLQLNSIQINYGSTLTPSPDVVVSVNYQDSTPTNYMISERSDFSGATWTTWTSNLINYSFTSFGNKTIYLKIQDANYTTPSVNASINYAVLALNSIVINSGNTTTSIPDVSILVNYSGGTPTQFKLSENTDLSSTPWSTWTGSTIPFTISSGFTAKTIYCQIKDNYTTGATKSSSITYVSEQIEITSFVINSGNTTTDTQNVTLSVSYLGLPNQYNVSESSGFTGSSWLTYSGDTIPFTLSSGYTNKTIYFKIRTISNYESNVANDTINYAQTKIVVSLAGSSYSESTYQTVSGDTINVLGYASNESYSDFQLKDTSGNNNGYFVVKPSESPTLTGFTIQPLTYNISFDPTLSGNTGLYPDVYINRYMYPTNSQTSGNTGLIRFKGLTAGEYTINILKSSSSDSNTTYIEDSIYQLNFLCNNVAIVNPITDVPNNTTGFTTIKGVTVYGDGFLDIQFWNVINKYYMPGINLIEIIKEPLDRTIKTYLVDLGSGSVARNSPTPYNNFVISGNSDVPQYSAITNLNSINNQKSTIGLVVTSTGFAVQDDGVVSGTPYVNTASRDSFSILYPNTGTMQITGCNDTKIYTIKILETKEFSGAVVDVTVNGVMQSQDITANLTPLVWNNVTSTAGIIDISTVSLSSGRNAQISVIEIIEQ